MCSVCLNIAIHARTALSIAPANVDSGGPHNSASLNSSIYSSSAVLIAKLGRRRSQSIPGSIVGSFFRILEIMVIPYTMLVHRISDSSNLYHQP
jgi:hypothetical protein